MEYKGKYLKYKRKYIDLKNKLYGGSYIISSPGIIQEKLIIYPEVSILLNSDLGVGDLGEGFKGYVQLGTIIECKQDPHLIGKKVAIKTFKESAEFISEKKQSEKNKMIEYGLDKDHELIETNYVASLYFDITTGPLENRLVYEYGGNILCNYVREPSIIYNFKNNKRIMLQLFTILHKLTTEHNNLHNDIKCDNIVYTVNENNEVDIKIIDFGASINIDKLTSGKETLYKRTNMNTPETIYNHLLYNRNPETREWAKKQNPLLNQYDRWYYYPFISIVYFLYMKQEYSTSGHGYIHDIIPLDRYSTQVWKQKAFEMLADNDNIIRIIKLNTNRVGEDDKTKIPYEEATYIINLINMICRVIPSERESPENIISFLKQ